MAQLPTTAISGALPAITSGVNQSGAAKQPEFNLKELVGNGIREVYKRQDYSFGKGRSLF